MIWGDKNKYYWTWSFRERKVDFFSSSREWFGRQEPTRITQDLCEMIIDALFLKGVLYI